MAGSTTSAEVARLDNRLKALTRVGALLVVSRTAEAKSYRTLYQLTAADGSVSSWMRHGHAAFLVNALCLASGLDALTPSESAVGIHPSAPEPVLVPAQDRRPLTPAQAKRARKKAPRQGPDE